MPTNNIVVYGGSFNPCTLAHKHILNEAMSKINASKGIILLTGNLYNKDSLIDFKHRKKMLEIMFRHQKVEVSDYENIQDHQPKSLESLTYLQSLYPDANLYFIMGLDNFANFKSWYHPQEILNNFHLIIIDRESLSSISKILDDDFYQPYLNKIHIIKTNEQIKKISATKARDLIANNNFSELTSILDSNVIKYIKDYLLYK